MQGFLAEGRILGESEPCVTHGHGVLLHRLAIRCFHIVTIFHHLNARNGATLYLRQNLLEMASIPALPFLSE